MTRAFGAPLRAVVLAAGQGKRMKSSQAKVLHEVLGRTIVGRILGTLDELAPESISIVVGHQCDQVIEYLKAEPPSSPYTTQLQSEQLGTGHALQQVVPSLTGFEGTILVCAGDTPLLRSSTLREFISKHQEDKAMLSLLTTHVDDPRNYGRIVRDALGHVNKIVEDKDATDDQRRIREINTGIYCFEWPAVADGLKQLTNDNKQKEYYLTDLVCWAHNKDRAPSSVVAMDNTEVVGINSKVELAEATTLLRARVARELALEHGVTIVDPLSTWIAPEVEIGADSVIHPGCYLIGQIQIGEDCRIGPHTVMNGKVTVGARSRVHQSLVVNSSIGADCAVGPFAHLRDQTVLSDHIRVGNFVEIKNSDVAHHSNVSHLSYIGDATLGSDVNIGAGTITANYDHITKVKERTVIGDGTATGSNSVLVAPVQVGKDSYIGALTAVTQDVPAGALAVGRAKQRNIEGWAAEKKQRNQQ